MATQFTSSDEEIDREFLITSTTMTPTAESDRDFLLLSNNTPINASSVINVTCICPQGCICSQCTRCKNSRVPSLNRFIRPQSPTTPLLSPERNSEEQSGGLCRYGSMSPIPSSPTESISDETEPLITSPNIFVNGDLPLNASIRCECHVKQKNPTSRKAQIKLIIACVIALLFMTGEVVGGYFSHSLAIMTDAAHMLSDFASFLISLFSIWMATHPPSKQMSFGWHRAEVMGAVISVLIIWLITGVLVYEAILRILHYDNKINADIMLITACVGVFVNVFMCMVLHQHDHHGHGHGHGHGHSHRHSHNSDQHSYNHKSWWHKLTGRRHDHDGEGEEEGNIRKRQRNNKKEGHSINVRAAFIHVIGDLIQSIGVVIAGYIIKFWPNLHIVDPICTFLFSILVIISTLNVLRDAVLVLMEGAPRHIDTEAVEKDLQGVSNVRHAHSIHIWSLTISKAALAAHLAITPGTDSQPVLIEASRMLRDKYGFAHTTLQVEYYQDKMNNCGTCQRTSRANTPSRRGGRIGDFLNLKRNSVPI